MGVDVRFRFRSLPPNNPTPLRQRSRKRCVSCGTVAARRQPARCAACRRAVLHPPANPPGPHRNCSGVVWGVKYCVRTCSALTNCTSAEYLRISGLMTCQAGWNTQGASTNSTWPTRLG
jgi:hypothetical protein